MGRDCSYPSLWDGALPRDDVAATPVKVTSGQTLLELIRPLDRRWMPRDLAGVNLGPYRGRSLGLGPRPDVDPTEPSAPSGLAGVAWELRAGRAVDMHGGNRKSFAFGILTRHHQTTKPHECPSTRK